MIQKILTIVLLAIIILTCIICATYSSTNAARHRNSSSLYAHMCTDAVVIMTIHTAIGARHFIAMIVMANKYVFAALTRAIPRTNADISLILQLEYINHYFQLVGDILQIGPQDINGILNLGGFFFMVYYQYNYEYA
jgi:hypothetical protein